MLKCVQPVEESTSMEAPKALGWRLELHATEVVLYKNWVQVAKRTKKNTGWWYTYPSEKYEFVNGKDDIPYMKWKIKFMFETTNQFINVPSSIYT